MTQSLRDRIQAAMLAQGTGGSWEERAARATEQWVEEQVGDLRTLVVELATWRDNIDGRGLSVSGHAALSRLTQRSEADDLNAATRDEHGWYPAGPITPPAEPQDSAGQPGTEPSAECHGLDTPERVCFYEQDFYVLSNFSSFSIMWRLNKREGLGRFDTAEHLYHWLKFSGQANPKGMNTADQRTIAAAIRAAPSAHEAFKIAEHHRSQRRRDWDEIKVGVMRDILRAKADQHEYVRRKLLTTADRELVENSWRDDFWGWGPNCDGQNMLGKLWMEIRAELRAAKGEVQ